MKRGFKRLFSTVLAAALAVSGLGGVSPAPQVYAQETQADGYEIYPTPHEISYQDGTYIIHSEVSVVKDEEIDAATQNRLTELLSSKGKKESAQGKTKIYLGVYNSGHEAAKYIQEKYTIDAALFEHYGAHYVISDKNTICILGKDTDAVFYGLTSLKHIFNQMDGSTIRNFTIKDYADTNIRGFIEGYYGIPWSNEDRISLMQFGGEFKMTSYVFAPKDDPYHSAKWRELYPEKELAEIQKMAEAGNAAKCRFVWTIHPFMHNRITEATYDRDIQIIKDKFEQLYNVGVRQFGVLGDDSGNLSRSVVIRTMNDLQQWVDEKGDVYDLVFCPQGYNDSWQGNYSELNELDQGLDKRIKIFWTGQAVCQPIEQKTLTNFRTKNLPSGKEARRAPLFWLNWPVNDINMSRLMMGKGSLLHPDINVNDLAGAVTNPMQDAQASKVALFAVADYAWNVADFDDDVSWADSFKYIDADAAESLHTLAKHMSDPSPNGHGLNLAESEELKPLLDAFMEEYEAGTYNADKAAGLIEEFEKIAAACDEFHALSQNENLKAELLPFTNALKDLAEANIGFLNSAAAIEAGNSSEAWAKYSEAAAELAASKNHDRKTISGTKKALPGSKWIRPFSEKLNELLSVEVGGIVDDTKIITSLITNRNDTPQGALEKLLDNNEATEVIWKDPNSTKAGDYIGLSYSKPVKVTDITFKMGQRGNPNDTFQSAKLQYTENGKDWTDIANTAYTDRRAVVTVDGLDLTVKGIRLCATADQGNMWLGCKDIIVNKDSYATEPEEPGTVSGTGIYNTENMVIRAGNVGMITDGVNDKSGNYAGFAHSSRTDDPDRDKAVKGAWVGLEFEQPTKIASIVFSQGTGDHIDKGTLEYSADGTNWTKIKSYDAIGENLEATFEPVTAKKIRLVNDETKAAWWRIYEITAAAPVSDATSECIYTNVENLKTMTAVSKDARTAMTAKEGITLKNGEYIGLKLNRIKDVTRIEADAVQGLTLQTSKNEVIWTDVSGNTYEDARYIRLINNSGSDVTFDLTKLIVESYEIAPISMKEANVAFYGDGKAMLAFDNDRTTEVIFNHSQRKGDFVTYDLGQTIELQSLALVSKDSAGDFPRHAKVSVSANGTDWTDVLFIGEQDKANKGEAEGTDNIQDVLPDHEISFNVKRAENLENIETRYIKFEVTRDKIGPDKWTRFTEIELNGGNMFLPQKNDPTVATDSEQSAGNVKDNLIDGEVGTTFRPVGEKAGSLTYYLSENTDQAKKLTILQSPSAISNAVVKAEVIKADTDQVTTAELGTLQSSLNEFDISSFRNVLSVTVEWTEGNVPEIHEIIVSGKAMSGVNKDLLTEYVEAHKSEDTSSWTAESKEAYDAALKAAQAVLANDYTTQTMVDDALTELKSAVENKETLGDFTAFNTAVTELIKDVLAEENYIPRTWKVYAQRLTDAQKAIAEKKDSQAKLDDLLVKLTTAKEALEYEHDSIEQLQLAYDEASALNAEDYTEGSYAAVEAASQAAATVLEAEKTKRQAPETFKEKLEALNNALAQLVSKQSIEDLQKKADDAKALNEENYTADSYAPLKEALTKAEEVLAKENPAKTEITEAADAIDEALKGLKAKGDENALLAEIGRLETLAAGDYTEESYAALTAKIAEVKEAIEAKDLSEEECTAFAEALSAANQALVEIKGLKAAVAEAEKVTNADGRYTEESYAALTAKIEEAKALYVNGTDETIAAAIEALAAAKADLRISAAEVEKLTAEYEKLLDGTHTKASEAALKAVIDQAKADAAAGNVTEEKLPKIKEALDEIVLIDITALKEAVKAAEEKAADEKYTTASRAEYQKVIDEAKALFEDGTETAIEDAIKMLKEKETVLKVKGDMSRLQAAYDEYAKIDLSKYTDNSAKALKDELNIVKFALDNGEQFTDAQIDEHIQALEAAKKALVVKPAEPDGRPDDRPDSRPDNGGQQPPQQGGGSASTGAGAKTGDPAMTMTFTVLLLAAFGCLAFFKKKRVQ